MTTKGGRFDEPGTAQRAMQRLLQAVAVLIVAAISTGLAADGGFDGRDDDRDDHEGRGEYAIGLWGDLTYSDLQATVGVPNLIADMNRHQLEFTVQDGDLKAGNGTPGSVTPTTCSDALYLQAQRFFNSLKAPAMFTPGDNDWTDCDRPSNGGFSSLERLDHERGSTNTRFSLASTDPSGGRPSRFGVGGLRCRESTWTIYASRRNAQRPGRKSRHGARPGRVQRA